MLAMYFPENQDFHGWQIVSHMFMHGGFMHIFFNMFALYSFGSALEHFWGSQKFLFFYVSCGLGAALLHTGINYYYFNDAISKYEDAYVLNPNQYLAQFLSKKYMETGNVAKAEFYKNK